MEEVPKKRRLSGAEEALLAANKKNPADAFEEVGLPEIAQVSPIFTALLSNLSHSDWISLRRVSSLFFRLVNERFASLKQIDVSDLCPGNDIAFQLRESNPIVNKIAVFLGKLAPKLERIDGGKFAINALLGFTNLRSIHIELWSSKANSARFFENNPNLECLVLHGTLPESAANFFGPTGYPKHLRSLNMAKAYLSDSLFLNIEAQKAWLASFIQHPETLENLRMPLLNRDMGEEMLMEDTYGFFPQTLEWLAKCVKLTGLFFHDRINWAADEAASSSFCRDVLHLPKLEALRLSHFNEPPPHCLVEGFRNAQQLRSVSIVRAYTETIDGLFAAVTEIKGLRKFVIQTPPWTLRNLLALTSLESLSLRPMYCEHIEEVCQILNKNLPALTDFKFEYFGDQNYPQGNRREVSVLDIDRHLESLTIDFSQGGYDVLVFRFGTLVKQSLKFLQLIGPKEDETFKGPDGLFQGLLLGCTALEKVIFNWSKVTKDAEFQQWIRQTLPANCTVQIIDPKHSMDLFNYPDIEDCEFL